MYNVNNENDNFDNVISIEDKIAARKEYEDYMRSENEMNELMNYLDTNEYWELIDYYDNGNYNQDEFGEIILKFIAKAKHRKANEGGMMRNVFEGIL